LEGVCHDELRPLLSLPVTRYPISRILVHALHTVALLVTLVPTRGSTLDPPRCFSIAISSCLPEPPPFCHLPPLCVLPSFNYSNLSTYTPVHNALPASLLPHYCGLGTDGISWRHRATTCTILLCFSSGSYGPLLDCGAPRLAPLADQAAKRAGRPATERTAALPASAHLPATFLPCYPLDSICHLHCTHLFCYPASLPHPSSSHTLVPSR